MKSNNRSWTSDQDSLLTTFVNQSNGSKIKWTDIATALHSNFGRQKSGKQCRERWQHQLNPTIVKNQWSIEEQNILFKLQIELGNKWSLIAEHLPGRTDNGIKNFFYSSIRKVFTKINSYLTRQRERKQFKSIRQFQADYLSKLMTVVDGNFDKKVRIAGQQTFEMAKEILSRLASLLNFDISFVEENDQMMNILILNMHQFRKNCKKRKTKRSDQFDRQFIQENYRQYYEQKQSLQVEKHQIQQIKQDEPQINTQFKIKNESNKSNMIKSIHQYTNSGQKHKVIEDFTNATWNSENQNVVEEVLCSEPDEALFNIFQQGQEQPQEHYWQFLQTIPETNIKWNSNREIDQIQDYLCVWDQLQSFPILSESHHILSRSQSFHIGEAYHTFNALQSNIERQQNLLNIRKQSFCTCNFTNEISTKMK